MKTAIQDFIDEAIKYSRELSTEGYLNESLAVDHIIDLAESKLEKEEDYRKRMREIVAQELHNLGMPTDRAIDQAAFESEYGYSSTNYNSFKEGVKWVIEHLKTFNTKER